MRRLLFIYNPHAGRGRVRGKLADILNTFTRAGCLVTVWPTQGAGDATRAARELAATFDRVVCCGGDGTLHEVISGLLELPREARPSLGYIPSGTTNDFARNLSLPKGMEEAATVAALGEARPCDMGSLNGEPFVYVAAFGAFTNVAYNTPQEFKNAFGHLAYLLKGVSELGNLPAYSLRLEYQGGVVEGEYIYGMVSNTISVGGLIGLPADQVVLDDGRLEAVLVPMPRDLPQLQSIIRGLARQEYTAESGIVALHSSSFRVTSPKPIPFTLDGEFGGEHEEAEIEALPKVINIVYGE